jgi:hypothetical protein
MSYGIDFLASFESGLLSFLSGVEMPLQEAFSGLPEPRTGPA